MSRRAQKLSIPCHHCSAIVVRKPSEIGKTVFCGKQCYYKAVANDKTLNGRYAGGTEVPCTNCASPIYKSPHKLVRANKPTFCSRDCLGAWRSIHMIGEHATNYRGGKRTINCQHCQAPIITRNETKKYCSFACRVGSQQKEKIRLSCTVCSADIHRRPSDAHWREQRGYKRAVCSKECRAVIGTGPNSPNWLEDRTQLANPLKSVRMSVELRTWRQSVFVADDYTCQLCFARSKAGAPVVLNAHHIRRFIDCPELRAELTNGVTLCEPCHKLTYGKEEEYAARFDEIVARREIINETVSPDSAPQGIPPTVPEGSTARRI